MDHSLDSGLKRSTSEDQIHFVLGCIDGIDVVHGRLEGALGHVDTVDAQQLIAHRETRLGLAVGIPIPGQVVDAHALLHVLAGGGEYNAKGLAQSDSDEGFHVLHQRLPLELVLLRTGLGTPRSWLEGDFGRRSVRVVVIIGGSTRFLLLRLIVVIVANLARRVKGSSTGTRALRIGHMHDALEHVADGLDNTSHGSLAR